MILRFITEDWRLKLLGLGLAVLMLGAVGFAQNQPQIGSLDVGLNYVVTSSDIILINPPAKVPVTYTGLADQIAKVNSSTLVATVYTTGAKPGTAVKLNVAAQSLIQGVSVQQPAPIAVNIDTRQVIQVPVQVRAIAASGWEIDPTKTLATCPGAKYANPCQVQFDGPVGWEAGLKAVTSVTNVAFQGNLLNEAVQLQPGPGIDITQRTVPQVGVDVTSCNIHVEAQQGATSTTVPLVDAPPSKGPPPGYRITAITITPLAVTIVGDPSALSRIQNIVLPPQDLSRSTSDATFTVPITYPRGASGDLQTATVKYSISANPNVSPSPGS
jgi:YbbR domain-containing protein